MKPSGKKERKKTKNEKKRGKIKNKSPKADMHEILFNVAAIEENGTWYIVDIDF